MSVRKRAWVSGAETKEAWIVTYTDAEGDRVQETFRKKRDADARQAEIKVALGRGIHTSRSRSITVGEAGKLWLATAEANRLERTTIDHYRQHLALHIVPYLGRTKLADLSPPMVRAFESHVGKKVSQATVRKIIGSLSGLLADAFDNGLVARNVVRERSRHRGNGQVEKRHRGKLKFGIDIPSIEEVGRMLAAAEGRWKPLLMVAALCGLRASELRGLRWADVDLKNGKLHVCQRADRYNVMGSPKSAAGERSVPILPDTVAVLREWRLRCPTGALDLVFPNGAGKIENLANILIRGLAPTLVAAGITRVEKDDSGKVIAVKPKYSGLHCLRHFYASWCINRRSAGGLELPAKVVQERLGHSSITMTYDRYGHLFPGGDDTAEQAAAERALLGAT
ncbi:MAG TPA: tyrosine-type recombinase/integrase [Xanthobacteraceae bacterium]